MNSSEQIEIPFKKQRILLYIIGCLSFILAGLWFNIEPERFMKPFRNSEELIRIIGVSGILFFGLVLISMVKKITGKSNALTINENGVTDNASAVSAGFIKWDDIIKFDLNDVLNQGFIYIYVTNPKDYIKRKKNIISKSFMKANYKTFGTPITIPLKTLNWSPLELERTLNEQFLKYKIS